MDRGLPMRTLYFVLSLVCASSSAVAHHSPAQFDQTSVVVIEGTVTDFRWANPHVYLAVETIDPEGERYVQQVEAGPAGQLLPRGVTRDLLQPGDAVTVRANPNRRGSRNVVLGVELTTKNGSRFPLHARALTALDAGDDVATTIVGNWVPQPESFLRLRTEMRGWPMTEQARQVLAGDRSDMRAMQASCTPQGPPALMASSALIGVALNDDTVTFDIEFGQVRRVVHIGDEHPIDLEPTLLGHSIGRWDGSALVVDTIGFVPHPEGMGFEFPSSDAKHIVERFSLSADGTQLEYEITAEDSTYLTEAVTFQTLWDYRPEQTATGAPCDPSVARRFLEER